MRYNISRYFHPFLYIKIRKKIKKNNYTIVIKDWSEMKHMVIARYFEDNEILSNALSKIKNKNAFKFTIIKDRSLQRETCFPKRANILFLLKNSLNLSN